MIYSISKTLICNVLFSFSIIFYRLPLLYRFFVSVVVTLLEVQTPNFDLLKFFQKFLVISSSLLAALIDSFNDVRILFMYDQTKVSGCCQ